LRLDHRTRGSPERKAGDQLGAELRFRVASGRPEGGAVP